MPCYADFADYEKWQPTENDCPEDLGYMPEPEAVTPADSPFSPDEEF